MLVPSAAFTGGSLPCSTDYAAVPGTVTKKAHHTTWGCTLQMPSGTGKASAVALLRVRISPHTSLYPGFHAPGITHP